MWIHILVSHLFGYGHLAVEVFAGVDARIHPFCLQLLQDCLLAFLIAWIHRGRSRTYLAISLVLSRLKFDAVVVEPLDTFHIKLKLSIAQLFKIRHSKWQIQFLDGRLKQFEISLIVSFVFGRVIEFL